LRPGQTLHGRYQVGQLIGDGAMGSVYRANDGMLGRTVALKVLNPELWTSAKARQRMAREAGVLGRINHPNVINIHNVFDHGEALVLELEYVSGGTLSHRLDRGPLAVPEAARILRGMLDGLSAIHAEGIVHRDLKPSNILMTEDGTPKLADLGVAHDASAKGLTGTGATLGTVDYMSPEQIQGRQVGPATDIYACGILLHQMVTGTVPFAARSDFEVMAAHLKQPPNLIQLQTMAPPALVHAVGRALAKDPAQRWGSAAELAQVIARLAAKPASAAAKTLSDNAPRLSREQLEILQLSAPQRDSVPARALDSGSAAGVSADTIVSTVTGGEGAKYGKCLPIAVVLTGIVFVLAMLVVGALLLGVVQLRSGHGIQDLVEQSR
jgi:serine/threonine-protein kinase